MTKSWVLFVAQLLVENVKLMCCGFKKNYENKITDLPFLFIQLEHYR